MLRQETWHLGKRAAERYADSMSKTSSTLDRRGERGEASKRLLTIHRSSSKHWVGNGFPVRSVFSYSDLGRDLSPFLLLDYVPPTEFPPGNERRGVGAHPHRGFETVTIAFQGELEHRDSTGAGGTIGPGDVQWMTAAGGIIHEEFHSQEFTRKGGTLEMAQLWVNLPAKHKNAAPGYQTLKKADIPVVDLGNGSGTVRVIAGRFDEASGPARTFTPINLWDIRLMAGKSLELQVPSGHTLALLMLKGTVNIGEERSAAEGDLAIFDRSGESMKLSAGESAHFLVMSGEPINEPIVGSGPFVMNSRAEIEKAFEDFQLGRMGKIGR